MKYVSQGSESAARLTLLLDLTKISSEAIQDALHDHLVKGLADSTSADLNGVDRANFKRALNKVNEVAGIVEAIKNLDYAGSYLSHLKDNSNETN